MTMEDRLALLENQIHEIYDVIEQIAKDADLLGVNVMRALKGIQPQSQDTRQYTWNPLQIKWTQKTGEKGPFEISDDYNSVDFKAMLKDLAEHKGALNRDNCFYWIFQNGASVGRKVVKK